MTASRLAIISIIFGIMIFCLKMIAYRISGSVAIWSDALESLVNIATACLALWAIYVAAQPADEDHPYGHHKAELFSAVGEAIFIILAAIAILFEAWNSWLMPRQLESLGFAGILLGIATLINFGWGTLLITQGRKLNSAALSADGHHLRTDVITSIGVVLGLALAHLTKIEWIDPALAVLVAVHILYTGGKLLKGSLSGLLDESLPQSDLDTICKIISDKGAGAVQAHALRTRTSGSVIFLEFHLVVPGDMRVDEAHALCDNIEDALETHFPNMRPIIHIEPAHKAEEDAITIDG